MSSLYSKLLISNISSHSYSSILQHTQQVQQEVITTWQQHLKVSATCQITGDTQPRHNSILLITQTRSHRQLLPPMIHNRLKLKNITITWTEVNEVLFRIIDYLKSGGVNHSKNSRTLNSFRVIYPSWKASFVPFSRVTN